MFYMSVFPPVAGHKQVRVFLCHGGQLSLQEAVYHGTPLVVLPIFADQFENSRLVRNAGLGHLLVWEELTANAVITAVTDVVNNSRLVRRLLLPLKVLFRSRSEPLSVSRLALPKGPSDTGRMWPGYRLYCGTSR